MTIRPAGPDDATAVANIRIAGWQTYAGLLDAAYVSSDAFAQEARSSAVAWLGEMDELGRSPSGATMLVHELDDGVDGWVSFGPDRRDEQAGEVWGLYVSPSSWGSGTSRRLIRAASDGLRSQGFVRLGLWCLDGNERALRFYRRERWMLDGSREARDFGLAGSADELHLRFVGHTETA